MVSSLAKERSHLPLLKSDKRQRLDLCGELKSSLQLHWSGQKLAGLHLHVPEREEEEEEDEDEAGVFLCLPSSAALQNSLPKTGAVIPTTSLYCVQC